MRQPVFEQEIPDEGTFSFAEAATSEMVKRYRPLYLGNGAEQIVYEIPGRPNVVVKVNSEVMAGIQKRNGSGDLKVEIAEKLEEMLAHQRKRYAVLRGHYGPEHTLGLKQFLLKVPVTPDIIRAIHHDDPPSGAEREKEAWAFVSIQERAKEFDDPDHLSVTSAYLENRTDDRAAYDRITCALAEGGSEAEIDWDEYFEMYSWQRDFFDTLKQSEGLRETIADFVRKTQVYTQATGEILDLGGGENVTVYQEGGKWNYHLVDALYPSMASTKQFENAKRAVEKLLRGETPDADERSDLLNAVNFTRTMNALAIKTGVKERLKLLPDGATSKLNLLGYFHRT